MNVELLEDVNDTIRFQAQLGVPAGSLALEVAGKNKLTGCSKRGWCMIRNRNRTAPSTGVAGIELALPVEKYHTPICGTRLQRRMHAYAAWFWSMRSHVCTCVQSSRGVSQNVVQSLC